MVNETVPIPVNVVAYLLAVRIGRAYRESVGRARDALRRSGRRPSVGGESADSRSGRWITKCVRCGQGKRYDGTVCEGTSNWYGSQFDESTANPESYAHSVVCFLPTLNQSFAARYMRP